MGENIEYTPEEVLDEAEGIIVDKQKAGEEAVEAANQIVLDRQKKEEEAGKLGNFFKKTRQNNPGKTEMGLNILPSKKKPRFNKLISKN